MERQIQNGNATYTAGGSIARGQFVKFSSGKVVACDAATDIAIAVALDDAVNGAIVPVMILGAGANVVEIRAAGAITQGAEITVEGKEQTAAGTTEIIVGRALEAATASGQYVLAALTVAHGK